MQSCIPGQFWVNEPGRVFVARRDRKADHDEPRWPAAGRPGGTDAAYERSPDRYAHPFVDAMLLDGFRLHVVILMATRSAGTSAAGPARTSDQPHVHLVRW